MRLRPTRAKRTMASRRLKRHPVDSFRCVELGERRGE